MKNAIQLFVHLTLLSVTRFTSELLEILKKCFLSTTCTGCKKVNIVCTVSSVALTVGSVVTEAFKPSLNVKIYTASSNVEENVESYSIRERKK